MANQYDNGYETGLAFAAAGVEERTLANMLNALDDGEEDKFFITAKDFTNPKVVQLLRKYNIDFDSPKELEDFHAGLYDGYYEEDEGYEEDEDEEDDDEESYRSSMRSSRKAENADYDPDIEPAKVFPLNMGWVTDYFYDRKIVAKMLKYWGYAMTFDRRPGFVVSTSEQGVFDQYSQYMGEDKEILSWFVNTLKAAKASGYDYVFFVLKQ